MARALPGMDQVQVVTGNEVTVVIDASELGNVALAAGAGLDVATHFIGASDPRIAIPAA